MGYNSGFKGLNHLQVNSPWQRDHSHFDKEH